MKGDKPAMAPYVIGWTTFCLGFWILSIVVFVLLYNNLVSKYTEYNEQHLETQPDRQDSPTEFEADVVNHIGTNIENLTVYLQLPVQASSLYKYQQLDNLED